MEIDRVKFYEAALEAMRESATILQDAERDTHGKVAYSHKPASGEVRSSWTHTLVTEYDFKVQETILGRVFAEFPGIVPLAEEDTELKLQNINNKSEYAVVIDPIDGTADFKDGNLDYSILVGLMHEGRMVVSLGLYPETNQVYAAIRGQGARRILANNTELKIADLDTVEFKEKQLTAHYRLGKFLPEMEDKLLKDGYRITQNFTGFTTNLSGIKWILEGKSSAFIAPYTMIHDFGPPSLLVEECGGVLTRFDAEGLYEERWAKAIDQTFTGMDPGVKGSCRFRVIVANNKTTVDQIVQTLIPRPFAHSFE
jgi:fructose-1,6-bisphosphatase/inositol monophosphatase family enzyme